MAIPSSTETSPGVSSVAILGFAVAPETFDLVLETDRGMPIQTQRFGWALAHALVDAGVSVTLVSVEPVTDFPHNSRWLIRGTRFKHDDVAGVSVPFVNLTGAKHVSRFASAVALGIREFRGQVPDAVLVHGANSALLWAALRLCRRWHCPVVAVLTDAPGTRTRFDNALTSMLKRTDRVLIRSALRRISGVVALAPELARDLAPDKPTLLMEGIAESTAREVATLDGRVDSQVVVYAGGLHANYGVLDLLKAVHESRGSWVLELYGRGPAESAVQQAAAEDHRVKYGGLVSPDRLPEIYGRAGLLVNPRPSDAEFARHSFPSKLMEYLASGTPVMSTALPTIPHDYGPHLLTCGDGPRSIALAIDSFFDRPVEDRRRFGREGQAFILGTRGTRQQGLRIRQFLAERMAGSG